MSFSSHAGKDDSSLLLGDVSGVPQMKGAQQKKALGVQVPHTLLFRCLKDEDCPCSPLEVGTRSMPLSEPHTTALRSWRGSGLNFKNLKTKRYPFKRYIQLLLSSAN